MAAPLLAKLQQQNRNPGGKMRQNGHNLLQMPIPQMRMQGSPMCKLLSIPIYTPLISFFRLPWLFPSGTPNNAISNPSKHHGTFSSPKDTYANADAYAQYINFNANPASSDKFCARHESQPSNSSSSHWEKSCRSKSQCMRVLQR